MEREHFHGMMGESILGIGRRGNRMDWVFMLIIMECRERGNGRMGKGLSG